MIKKYLYFLIIYVCATFIGKRSFAQYGYDTVSIYFDIGKSTLLTEATRTLDSVAQLIQKEKRKILIYGYADYLGNGKPNYTLSEARSQKTLAYLLKKKVAKSAVIQTTGLGQITERGSDIHGNQDYRKVDIFIKRTEKTTTTTKNSRSIAAKIKQRKTGETFVLEDIFFHYNSSKLTQESLSKVNELYEALKKHPKLRISLEGHICCVEPGTDAWDEDHGDIYLSRNRARSIYNFLLEKGIPQQQITYKGYGKMMPIRNPELTEEDKEMNRRVEIRILKPLP